MRKIRNETMKKRGCAYCAEHKRKNEKDWCMHSACPYKELDNGYDEYLKKMK